MAVDTTRHPASTPWLPATLRSRLTLTVLGANIALMVVGGAILFSLLSLERPAQLQREASSALRSISDSVAARLATLDAIAATTVGVPGMEHVGRVAPGDRGAKPVEAMEAAGLLAEIIARTDADAIGVLRSDGSLVTVAGDAELLAAPGLARVEPARDTLHGAAFLASDRLVLVAIHPLPSPEGTWLAVAGQMTAASVAPTRQASFASSAPPSVPGEIAINRADFPLLGPALLVSADGAFFVRTELTGVDARPAVWLTASVGTDPTTFDVVGLSFLVASGLAIVVSLLVGILLTLYIRRPLDELVTHIRRHGHAALDGHQTEPFVPDTALPVELQNLADVYNSLIEHLKRRQAEVAEATRALQFAVNNSTEGKVLFRDGRAVLANAAAATLFGLPAEAPLATWDAVLDSLAIESEDGCALTVAETLDRARQSTVVVRISGEDIPSRWVELSVIEHDDPNRTTLLTGRDITEQRRVDAIHSEIVSLVSHDLRAPLTVINGYLDILERPLPDDQRDRAVASARESAGRMAVLLEDLLTATRAEELFTPAVLEPVCLSSLAEETVSAFGHTSHHTLTCRASGSGTVLGEERRLRQVLVNLVTNATKHAPAHGTIAVGVTSHEGRVVLTVQDNGPGIPAEDREIIFERFTRLRAEGENRPGIGLGLYIVRAIVESHGGTVRTEDRSDGAEGARFVVELPEAP